MSEQTLRSEMLLGSDALARLRRSRVAVLGLGGVGSWCAEALARAGVGALTLVDEDTVSESNINRQCCALHSTIGLPKAEVMAARVRDINPGIAVDARTDPDFFIMARTDALAVEGLDVAIERAVACAEAGADGIFPEAMTELAMYERFAAAVGVPVLANIT